MRLKGWFERFKKVMSTDRSDHYVNMCWKAKEFQALRPKYDPSDGDGWYIVGYQPPRITQASLQMAFRDHPENTCYAPPYTMQIAKMVNLPFDSSLRKWRKTLRYNYSLQQVFLLYFMHHYHHKTFDEDSGTFILETQTPGNDPL